MISRLLCSFVITAVIGGIPSVTHTAAWCEPCPTYLHCETNVHNAQSYNWVKDTGAAGYWVSANGTWHRRWRCGGGGGSGFTAGYVRMVVVNGGVTEAEDHYWDAYCGIN